MGHRQTGSRVFGSFQVAYRAVLGLVLLSGLVSACGLGTVDVPWPSSTEENPGVQIDTSIDIKTAFIITAEEIAAGKVFTEALAPKFDDDFWRLTVTEPGQLVTVRVEYMRSASPVRLAIDWIGPRDLCVPTAPAACARSSDCAAPLSFCDAPRGGCRATDAAPCIASTDCAAGDTCAQSPQEALATVLEPDGSLRHLVLVTLRAEAAGDYFIRVYDQSHQVDDPTTRYELTVAFGDDPDLHEPNNAPNRASPLASGVAAQGYFASLDDIDWYRIDPQADAGITTPAIAAVELRWPTGTEAAPKWTIIQAGKEIIKERTPRLTGTDNVVGATLVLPSAAPFYVRIENPSRVIDPTFGYELTIKLSADPDEGAERNDTALGATVLDASSFRTLHDDTHTLIAENDLDWYRVDRAAGISENSLLYIEATTTSADIMLQVLVYEKIPGAKCDPASDTVCASGGMCVCPFSGTCGPTQGACIRPWVQRPVPNDPDGDPQLGGRTPNNIKTQLPVYDAGPGAYFVQVAHLTQVFPPRAGFSATDTYHLKLVHKQEPDAWDRAAAKNEFVPEPFGADESVFESHRRPQQVGSVGSSASGFLSYDGDQDWFRFSASGIPVGQARLIVTMAGTPVDLRFRVYRGGGAVGDGASYDAAWNGAVSGEVVLDPANECTHLYSGDDTIDVWVNDVDFNDFDDTNAYTIRLEMKDGCDVGPCALCRCQPDQGCGCGKPAPTECGCSMEHDVGCGCGNPAPVTCSVAGGGTTTVCGSCPG